MYKFYIIGLLIGFVSSLPQKNFISIPLVKHVDESGARILQEAVLSGELNNKSSLAKTLAHKFKDDKYLQHFGKVEIGTPPQKFNVAFNPANSLVLIASNNYRRKCAGRFRAFDEYSSHSYREAGESIKLSNGSLGIKITKDTFHVGKVNVLDQHFGLVINGSCEDAMYDGVIGLGFSTNYLTFVDNLFKQQALSFNKAGLFLDRNLRTTNGGEVDLGYWNPKFVANPEKAEYIPIVNKANPTWAIHVKMAYIGNEKVTFDRYTLIDLNSFFIDMPSFEAQIIARAIGAFNFGGNLVVDCSRVNKLPNLIIHIENSVYTLEGNDYVDTVNSFQNYCVVLIRSRKENIWTLGGVFVGKYYTILDYENKQIAFAQLILPKSEGSGVHVKVWYFSPLILLTLLAHYVK